MDTRALARFRKNKGAVVGLFLVVALVAFSALVPLVVAHSPYEPDFEQGRGPFGTPGAPSRVHWMGTDTLFRDLLVRLAYGGRLSLQVAFVATAIAVTLGTAVGVASGFFEGTRVRIDRIVDATSVTSALGGAAALAIGAEVTGFRLLGLAAWLFASGLALRTVARVAGALRRERLSALDWVESLVGVGLAVHVARAGASAFGDHTLAATLAALSICGLAARVSTDRGSRLPWPRVDFDDVAMRTVDVLLAFPFLLLLMALGAAIDRTTEGTLFLVLGLTAWTGTARVIRGKTLQLRELDFVVASRALGQPTGWIVVRHVLPNLAGISVVLATNAVAGMIVAEAALAFLGLSLPPPTASWGRMLDEGRPYFAVAPWLLVAPGAAILLAVLGFNLLGEGLRDALDPKDA